MKIPKKIKSQGLWWSIKLVDDMDDLGKTDYDKQTIEIRSHLSKHQQEITLLHEILHTINTTLNHDTLDSFAIQLHQVLSDNNLLK
jgi:hypothetical protein